MRMLERLYIITIVKPGENVRRRNEYIWDSLLKIATATTIKLNFKIDKSANWLRCAALSMASASLYTPKTTYRFDNSMTVRRFVCFLSLQVKSRLVTVQTHLHCALFVLKTIYCTVYNVHRTDGQLITRITSKLNEIHKCIDFSDVKTSCGFYSKLRQLYLFWIAYLKTLVQIR